MEISSHNPTGDGGGPREARSLRDPDNVANYRIIEEIGRGGQGIVFLAEDLRNGKRVALKVLRDRGEISPDSLERLRREVEAVARLHHPCICGVHEAVLDGSNPFIAMNYVSGRTLAKAIETEQRGDDKTLVIRRDGSGSGEGSPSSRGALMRKGPSNRQDILRLVGVIEKVARALHVAHEARVIHRDIKPANIMLTAAGEPVILDFGLAHFEESGLEKLTKAGEIWGTVEYLSPEQLVGNRMKVDRRTDIWSLGVTLYECLTLRRPFEGPTSNQIFHAIQAKDPPDPCRVNPALPVDVRVVIETALEKDRDRRYETAQAFADDLKALCEGRQIAARPVGRITRLTRWAKRNPGVATSLLVTFGVLVTGIVVAAVLLLALKRSLADTKHALRRVDEESVKKDFALSQSRGLRLLAESSAILPRDPALALLLAREGGSQARDKQALTNGALIDALADLREHETLLGHLRPVETAEFSPDGSRVVTTTAGGEIRIWDVKTGETIATLSHPRVAFATFTPHGRFLVAFSSDAEARIWDARSWDEVAHFGDRDASDGNGGATSTRRADGAAELLRGNLPGIRAMTLSADASRVLIVRGGEATVWDPETGARVSSLTKPLGVIASITFSLDSSRILTVADGVVTVWDTNSGSEIATAPDPIRASRVTFSPDGTRVVALSPDRGQVWTVKDGHILDLAETSVSVDSVQFSPDGKRLVVITRNGIRAWDLEKETSREICGPDATRSSTYDPNADLSRPDATFTRDGRVVSASCHGTAHVWNADTGEQSAVLSGPAGDVRFITVSPKGDFVLTAASTGTATLWDTVNWNPVPLRGHSGEITHASFSADGSLVVTASSDRTARVWHTRNYPGAPLLEGHQGAITEIAFSRDGRLILTASSDGKPRLWRTADATLLQKFSAKKKDLSLPQLSPDGSRVLARGDEGSAVVLSVESGDVTATIRGDLDASEFTQTAFSPDGRLILTASDEGIVYVWDAATGREQSRYAGHRGTVISAAFCGGGTRMVTAASDRTVCFWNPEDGKEIAIHQGHAEQPPVVGPLGDRVAVVAPDGTIRICDGRTGDAVSTLTGKRHAAPRFSPDGVRLVTQSPQGSFKIWEVASGSEIASFPRDEGDSVQAFSPDGAMILTSTKDGTVWFWNSTTGAREHSIRGHGAPVTSAAYSPDGRFVVVFWWDETRVFDSETADELWTAPRRHGSIRAVRFSPDSRWLAVGHAGGVVRLWPSDPLAKASTIQPRELTLEELDAHEIDDEAARKKLRIVFNEDMTNEDLVTTLERRDGLSPRLRSAAIAAARARDPREVARRLCRKAWNDVLAPYGARDHYFTALRRAEIALGLDPGVELGKTTLGAAQYRAGLAGAALATLEQAAKDAPHASTSIFIGMAHAKLGQLAEALTALANARGMLDSSGNYPDEIRRLLTEAESLCRAESRPG